jgi:hypothetical protein
MPGSPIPKQDNWHVRIGIQKHLQVLRLFTGQSFYLAALVSRDFCSRPGRGASCNRSSILKSSSDMSCSLAQRFRHSLTVSAVTVYFATISLFLRPFAAARRILARKALCCPTRCRLTSFSILVARQPIFSLLWLSVWVSGCFCLELPYAIPLKTLLCQDVLVYFEFAEFEFQ